MKEYDYIRLLVEKNQYAKDGIHKDMTGWICDARIINGCHLVCFDNCNLEDYPIIPVRIDDMEVIWNAPTKDIGIKVVLSVNVNSDNNIVLRRGLKGTIIAKCENDKHWIVHFEKQDGLQRETDCAVYESDIAII